MIEYLKSNHSKFLENLVVGTPDTGGSARVEAFRERLFTAGIESSLVIGDKRKEKGKIKNYNLSGEVEGKNVLFIDDILSTGSTLEIAQETARKKGAKKVGAYATHGIFTKGLFCTSNLHR